MPPATVFLSYSHKDEAWKDRLATHLGVLEADGTLSVWHDRQIAAGAEWLPEIEAAIQRAKVAVLLVSADFLSSPFVRRREIPKLLERRSRNGLRVIPVIVKDCAWQAVAALSGLQALPRDGKPLHELSASKLETELARITEEILKLVSVPGPGLEPRWPNEKRGESILRAVERALPIVSSDYKTLGLIAWVLDYFPGRSSSPAEREEAWRLKDAAFAPLRRRIPPPPLPGPGNPDWADIPSGSFIMGTPVNQQGGDDERPEHTVMLSSFRILAHPVTRAEFHRLVRMPNSKGSARLPAVNLTWYQAYAYAAWLGGRLPTEAEWEYAARAGSPHSYCDRHGAATTLDEVGWYFGNSNKNLHPVQQLEPNPWGLFDMYGNVWEWVADWYSIYLAEPQRDPWGPRGGNRRVMRGGSYRGGTDWGRAAYRHFWNPNFGEGDRGFRVVLPSVPAYSR